MRIFNHIGVKGKEDSAGIVNFGILAAEYVRQEQMANYLLKGKNQTNILCSSVDMENNYITNLKDPSDQKMPFRKDNKSSQMIINLWSFQQRDQKTKML